MQVASLVSFSQAIKIVDNISAQVKDRGLTDAEAVALRAAWENIKYTQAISESGYSYSESYLRSDAARNLWRMLSDYYGAKITKFNFRDYFESRPDLLATKSISSDILGGHPPSAGIFIGRKNEIKQLKQYSKIHQVICISGISGIGKSSLAAKVIHHLAKKSSLFDYYIWLPVYYQPNLSNLLNKVLMHLSRGGNIASLSSQDLTDLLMHFFAKKSVLNRIRRSGFNCWPRISFRYPRRVPKFFQTVD